MKNSGEGEVLLEDSKTEDTEISRRDAMQLIAKYSVAAGVAFSLLLSAKDALSGPDTPNPRCFRNNPPPFFA